MSRCDDWADGWNEVYAEGEADMLAKCLKVLDELSCNCTFNVAFWGHADECFKRIVYVALNANEEKSHE
jgi:hypothetical protein